MVMCGRGWRMGIAWLCLFGLFSRPLHADSMGTHSAGLVKIPAGTTIQGASAEGWSHVLLVANSRLTQGNTERVSATVKSFVTMFSFVMLADVEQKSLSDGKQQFELARVGVGLATEQGQGYTVVSGPPAAGTAPPSLSMMSGQVLKKMEASLEKIQIVARHPTLVVMDSPALVTENGEHVDRVVRNVIWTNPDRGGVGSVIWLLKPGPAGQLQLAQDEAVFLPPGFREDRELHVDETQFTLGIPSPKAFALVKLPAGRPFKIPGQVAPVFSRPRFDALQLKELGAQMMAAMTPLQ